MKLAMERARRRAEDCEFRQKMARKPRILDRLSHHEQESPQRHRENGGVLRPWKTAGVEGARPAGARDLDPWRPWGEVSCRCLPLYDSQPDKAGFDRGSSRPITRRGGRTDLAGLSHLHSKLSGGGVCHEPMRASISADRNRLFQRRTPPDQAEDRCISRTAELMRMGEIGGWFVNHIFMRGGQHERLWWVYRWG